jgi:hypothetical protein
MGREESARHNISPPEASRSPKPVTPAAPNPRLRILFTRSMLACRHYAMSPLYLLAAVEAHMHAR